MNNLVNRNSFVPPFIAFGTFEKADNSKDIYEVDYYDIFSQKTIIPFFCGSDKKITKSAKNVGSFIFPKYSNVTDDAKEK